MLGAIAGDMIGSVYEWERIKTKDFPLFLVGSTFTDDSVLTVATARSILDGDDFAACYLRFGREFPGRGYGGRFASWLERGDLAPYNSYGNGSAMRVSPIGWAADSTEEVLSMAEKSAVATHNHPEGVKGAQATALAIFMARKGADHREIRAETGARFGYDLSRGLDKIRPDYGFDVTCQGTVPEAIIAACESTGFEDAVRNAVSLGGDSDTLACITGSIAEAMYGGLPKAVLEEVDSRLDDALARTVREFRDLHVS